MRTRYQAAVLATGRISWRRTAHRAASLKPSGLDDIGRRERARSRGVRRVLSSIAAFAQAHALTGLAFAGGSSGDAGRRRRDERRRLGGGGCAMCP
jgi:hypothetical protein